MLSVFNVAMGIFCLLIASLADAKAVANATRVWENDAVHIGRLIRVVVYYGLSIVPFLYSIRFFNYTFAVSPGIQVLIWFVSTIVFIALLDGSFLRWEMSNQLLSIIIVISMAILVYRTSASH